MADSRARVRGWLCLEIHTVDAHALMPSDRLRQTASPKVTYSTWDKCALVGLHAYAPANPGEEPQDPAMDSRGDWAGRNRDHAQASAASYRRAGGGTRKAGCKRGFIPEQIGRASGGASNRPVRSRGS